MTTNELILANLNLANKIASCKKKSLPKHISFDEIQSAAYMGLTLAATRYDSSMGEFPVYASCRVAGAIKDYLRSYPVCGRSKVTVKFFEDKYDYAGEPEPENFTDFFDDLTNGLRAIAKRVLYYYFAEDFTLQQISEQVKMSKTRVHQILRGSIQELRDKINVSFTD